MADAEPDSLESGFFIDFISDDVFLCPIPQDRLPRGVSLYQLSRPDENRFPSLLILPDDNSFESYFSGHIPVICYGSNFPSYAPSNRPAVCDFIRLPLTTDEILYRIGKNYKPGFFSFPGGWIRLGPGKLYASWGELTLSRSESRFLQTLINSESHFLSTDEIHRILGIKQEIPLISRLRSKLEGFIPASTPLSVEISPVKGVGYYLGITVDNLWKTV